MRWCAHAVPIEHKLVRNDHNDSDANEILQGVLALAGGDINLNTLTVVATDIVAISTLTVTMPAS